MPGPMSNPNGVNEIHTIVEHVDGERLKRKIPTDRLTGAQRVYLAHRGKLTTGKTRKNRERK